MKKARNTIEHKNLIDQTEASAQTNAFNALVTLGFAGIALGSEAVFHTGVGLLGASIYGTMLIWQINRSVSNYRDAHEMRKGSFKR